MLKVATVEELNKLYEDFEEFVKQEFGEALAANGWFRDVDGSGVHGYSNHDSIMQSRGGAATNMGFIAFAGGRGFSVTLGG